MSSPHAASEETKVTSLELFFDLVFVFAITQVTGLLAADPSALGAVRGLVVLATVWWAWVAYAWLTNSVNADRAPVRLALLVAMSAMLVVSLAVPHAWSDGALTFAVALVSVRVAHLALFWTTSRTVELRRAVLLLAPGVLVAGALVVVGALVGGTTQLVLWCVALAFDYGAPLLGGGRGWRVSPAHFAERHGLIVIIALGEAIISLGVGAEGLELDAGVVAGAALGLLTAFCLWWLYFDASMAHAEHKLRSLDGEARNRLARDSYSYLHLPIVAGVVLFALAAKKTLAHVAEPLHDLGLFALGAGPGLVLLTLSVLRARHVGKHNRFRLPASAMCVAAIAPAAYHSALAGLACVTGVLGALVVVEVVYTRHVRRRAAAASPMRDDAGFAPRD